MPSIATSSRAPPFPLQKRCETGREVLNRARSTLPNDDHLPTFRLQVRDVPGVSLGVLLELLKPEFAAGLRHGRVAATGMVVPETSMHEDDGSILGKDDVGSAWKTLRVQAEPEPETM